MLQDNLYINKACTVGWWPTDEHTPS